MSELNCEVTLSRVFIWLPFSLAKMSHAYFEFNFYTMSGCSTRMNLSNPVRDMDQSWAKLSYAKIADLKLQSANRNSSIHFRLVQHTFAEWFHAKQIKSISFSSAMGSIVYVILIAHDLFVPPQQTTICSFASMYSSAEMFQIQCKMENVRIIIIYSWSWSVECMFTFSKIVRMMNTVADARSGLKSTNK